MTFSPKKFRFSSKKFLMTLFGHLPQYIFQIPKTLPTFFTEANSIFTEACLTSQKIYRGSRLGCLNGRYGAGSRCIGLPGFWKSIWLYRFSIIISYRLGKVKDESKRIWRESTYKWINKIGWIIEERQTNIQRDRENFKICRPYENFARNSGGGRCGPNEERPKKSIWMGQWQAKK